MLKGWGSAGKKAEHLIRFPRSAREQSPQIPVKAHVIKGPGQVCSMGGCVCPAGSQLPYLILFFKNTKSTAKQRLGMSGRCQGKTMSAGSKVDTRRGVTSFDPLAGGLLPASATSPLLGPLLWMLCTGRHSHHSEEGGPRTTNSDLYPASWISLRTTSTSAVHCVGWLEPWSVCPEGSQAKWLQLSTAVGPWVPTTYSLAYQSHWFCVSHVPGLPRLDYVSP